MCTVTFVQPWVSENAQIAQNSYAWLLTSLFQWKAGWGLGTRLPTCSLHAWLARHMTNACMDGIKGVHTPLSSPLAYRHHLGMAMYVQLTNTCSKKVEGDNTTTVNDYATKNIYQRIPTTLLTR